MKISKHSMNSVHLFAFLFYLVPTLSISRHKTVNLDDKQWNEFKTRFNRIYNSALDREMRLNWENNFRKVNKHNQEHDQGEHTYKLKINYLADLSPQQYRKKIIKLKSRRLRPHQNEITMVPHHNSSIPEELDWRKEGFITEPQNQEDCGSCYAFSISSCVQGQYFKKKRKIKNFSSQQLIDCSISTGNLGCAGGSLRNTLKYIQLVGGLMLQDDYPYTAKQEICRYERSKAEARLKTWGILPPKDENTLKIAVAVYGPIAVSLNASPTTFQLYASGIYNDPECSSEYVNHAMLLVGYTKKAWILKNWWSAEWGDNGYMLMARGANTCAIANYAAYATIH